MKINNKKIEIGWKHGIALLSIFMILILLITDITSKINSFDLLMLMLVLFSYLLGYYTKYLYNEL